MSYFQRQRAGPHLLQAVAILLEHLGLTHSVG